MNTNDTAADSFNVAPVVAWFLIGSPLFFLAVFIVISWPDLSSDPSRVPVFVWLGDAFFVGLFVLGVYYKTLRVVVSDTALKVSSLFGHRVTALSDIASVAIKDNGQWRTMDVKDNRNRRVLYIRRPAYVDSMS